MSNSFLHDGMLRLSIPGPSRDPSYYIADGNTVLLVDNTLFKVHRSILMKDKSAFETMFQLTNEADSASSDSGLGTPEGDGDHNPIRLQGDTAEDFRALLWALYALPHELMLATSPDANSTQLAGLARMSHKYQFRSIEMWVLTALHGYYSRPGAFENIPSTVLPSLSHSSPAAHNPPSLVQITELAALCEHQDLLDLAVARWKRQIGLGKDLALAIEIGERLSLRPILGLAYHAMMLKGKAHWEAESLSREQRVRLLNGYYALTKMWEVLPSQPPILAHSGRCPSNQRCSKAFGQLWKYVVDMAGMHPGLQKEDVLNKFNMMEGYVKALVAEREGQAPGEQDGIPNCRESAVLVTAHKVREFRDTLTDYFSEDF
ncbi:hypothetical protein IEO21_10313 [Rhodonia placenta]|uniref:BTB domain-containing protein n=1 Tax=Rhodonia placenta TaxID=104341 RepID=A0A8H7TX27_9APHY|nr:hypothetical protein IEO21_10313 [Postia placenta]